MSQILLIISSPRLDSHSTRVARRLADRLMSQPGSTLTGIADVEVIAVEGLAFGREAAERAVSTALARVDSISL